MTKGQCLCGSVKFEIDPSCVSIFNNCYCKNCQRSSGTGFVSQLQLHRSGFSWIEGEQHIKQYESSPGVHRAFCSTCGSRLPMTQISGPFVAVPAGLLDESPRLAPEVNMHLASKAEWAIVNESIECLQDQGSDEFWQSLFQARRSDG